MQRAQRLVSAFVLGLLGFALFVERGGAQAPADAARDGHDAARDGHDAADVDAGEASPSQLADAVDVLDAGALDAGGASRPPVAAPHFVVIEAGDDRPIRVLPAAAPGRRVLVYLHGYCGDVNAVGAFVPALAAYGTLIALLGDQPCKDKPGRYKWGKDASALDARIRRAIRLVNRGQGLDLDDQDVTLFGYSQGAARAESLTRYYAKRYPRVILGGPPRRPMPEHFKHVHAIAVFGGEKEDTHDMLSGTADLIAKGFRAHFFLLPGVDHGDFGGELLGNHALSEILAFLSAPMPDSVPVPASVSMPVPVPVPVPVSVSLPGPAPVTRGPDAVGR